MTKDWKLARRRAYVTVTVLSHAFIGYVAVHRLGWLNGMVAFLVFDRVIAAIRSVGRSAGQAPP
jgi:hypothetical protein